MTRPVLDASALVALLLGEPGAIDAILNPLSSTSERPAHISQSYTDIALNHGG